MWQCVVMASGGATVANVLMQQQSVTSIMTAWTSQMNTHVKVWGTLTDIRQCVNVQGSSHLQK